MISIDKDIQLVVSVKGPRGAGKTFVLDILKRALKENSAFYTKPASPTGNPEEEVLIVGRNRRRS